MPQSELPVITNVADLKGKYVLVRLSLNVPIHNGVVSDEFRIHQSLPTVTYLQNKGARIVLCSHLGKDGEASMRPVYEVLEKYLSLTLSPEVCGEQTKKMRDQLQDGEVLLLENVRKDRREMDNDPEFARELAALADIFVNEDFAASHRAHASLAAICGYLPSYVGINFAHEYEELSKVMRPQSPSLFILGGAKFDTKMPLVEKYIPIYDRIFIGGALANDFFKAQGLNVGTSLVSEIDLSQSPLLDDPKVMLPVDVLVFDGAISRITTPDDVRDGESILDVGPKSVAHLDIEMQKAATVLWNGPLGNYENGYTDATIECARLLATSKAFSVVGGGDTVASIEELDNQDAYGFLSTAGGAMLTFLELGTLPALDALRKSAR